ncbi:MAG: 30S ribosomal protein S6 [Phycisphaerae bacterium]
MRTYEGMFLLDPAMASDFPKAEAEVKRVLDRAEAEVLGISKWDERKLAYPIRNHKRGLYVLSFFKASPDKIVGVDRDVKLSEAIIRALVLAKDGMTPEAVKRALATTPATAKPASRADDSAGRDRDRGRAVAAKPEAVAGATTAAGGPGETAAEPPATTVAKTADQPVVEPSKAVDAVDGPAEAAEAPDRSAEAAEAPSSDTGTAES